MRIGNDISGINNARMQQNTQKAQEKSMQKQKGDLGRLPVLELPAVAER